MVVYKALTIGQAIDSRDASEAEEELADELEELMQRNRPATRTKFQP